MHRTEKTICGHQNQLKYLTRRFHYVSAILAAIEGVGFGLRFLFHFFRFVYTLDLWTNFAIQSVDFCKFFLAQRQDKTNDVCHQIEGLFQL